MGQKPDNSIFVADLRLHRETKPRDFDLDALVHPGRVFAHPSEVVHHPALSLQEKRAILASWASDACAVESAPSLRLGAPGAKPVSFDEVMEALRALDAASGGEQLGADIWPRRHAGRPARPLRQALRRRFRGPGPEQGSSSGTAWVRLRSIDNDGLRKPGRHWS